MKTRFSTYDLICSITELQKYVGLRVNQVYDIDNKTYLIRLQKTEEKVIILLESGNRIHTTEYEWPKNPAPSGFSMKLRKHLKNKRLESVQQLGIDRIVDLQFGSGEVAHHVFLELFDRGNIMLTDHNLTILYVLRPHTQGDRYVFAVKEKYPIERARLKGKIPSAKEITSILSSAKEGDNLRKVLTPQLEYGPALIDHALLGVGLSGSSKIGKDLDVNKDIEKIMTALQEAEEVICLAQKESSKGYIVQKCESRPLVDGGSEELLVNIEFHPKLFRQHESSPYQEFPSFDKAVDIFFSSMEGQKIDMKVIQQERDALRKLENVRRDHTQRMVQLEQSKETDKCKAELITKNRELVEQAINGVRAMLAMQTPWPEVQSLVKQAAAQGNTAAALVKAFKLDSNHIVLQLTDPFSEDSFTDSEDEEPKEKKEKSKVPVLVEIDLGLSAFANARRYYDQKRTATKKQQKTLESQSKAFKSAEKKTKKSLKEMKSIVNITKARKVFWFEKFFWFISSENYLVIGGRDAVQNELIVKRYMRAGDIYVHADVHGASSIVIKNPTGEPIPPKTINEAGVMAICYSVAWEAKVITTAWWVNSHQVLKSAPSGEYLPTGSFTIRGKKNYLPQSNLIFGFSFLFKLEDESIARHADERRVKTGEEELSSLSVSESGGEIEDVEVAVSEGEDDEEDLPAKDEGTLEEVENDDAHENEENNDSDSDESEKSVEENNEAEDKENEEEKEDPCSFPDTQINILHSGKKMALETKPSGISESHNVDDEDEEESVVYLGDDKPVILKKGNVVKKEKKPKDAVNEQKKKQVKFQPAPKEEKAPEETKLKRGQRFKLKKIKEKYKDQDEEDHRLRLEYLQGSGKKKNSKKEKKKELARQAAEKSQKSRTPLPPKIREKKTADQDSEEEEAVEPAVNMDVALISSLTGIPHPDDELLFAVPVVAPYSTLQNYKFKVKLTPGTGKRGKAARTALDIFLKDKTTTQREKDLLKGVKDEELARNLPGKVKVSAPQMHKK